jgi:prevent-host-death family protein
MRQLAAFQVRRELGRLLDRVEGGEEIVITRRGNIVAKLVPSDGHAIDHERARVAARRIREMRKGVTLGGLKVKDLIHEGQPPRNRGAP